MWEGCGIGGMYADAGFVEDFTAPFGFRGRVVVILATRSTGARVAVGEREADLMPGVGSVEGGAREIVSDSSVVLRVQVTVLEVTSLTFNSAKSS